MPRPRFQKLSEEKREAIIQAAAVEFAGKGYTGSSMNRIIEEAGFSKGATYYYFDDKEDLFLTVILDAHDKAYDFMGDFPPVETPDEFWSEAAGLFEKALGFARENPLIIGLQRCFAGALARGELKRPLSEYQAPHFDFHRRFVRIGQEVGAVRTDIPDGLLHSILEAIDEAADSWFARHFDEIETEGWERILPKFLSIYRRILEPGPDTGPTILDDRPSPEEEVPEKIPEVEAPRAEKDAEPEEEGPAEPKPEPGPKKKKAGKQPSLFDSGPGREEQ
jgi:AcrR family transcriptional regulator